MNCSAASLRGRSRRSVFVLAVVVAQGIPERAASIPKAPRTWACAVDHNVKRCSEPVVRSRTGKTTSKNLKPPNPKPYTRRQACIVGSVLPIGPHGSES